VSLLFIGPPAWRDIRKALSELSPPDRLTKVNLENGDIPTDGKGPAGRMLPFYTPRRKVQMELGVDVRQVGSHSLVDVKGEIDVYTAPKLREKLIELVSQGSYDVVVNLEGVDFLDSTGLGVLVGALKRVKAHDGSLSLICTQDKILKIFKITGLTKVFSIHSSEAEATGGSE
jgi:anti-sigma B factor antagonist